MGMDLRGFLHHKRLTKMVRRDEDLGGRLGCIPRMSAKLCPLQKIFYLYYSVSKKIGKSMRIRGSPSRAYGSQRDMKI